MSPDDLVTALKRAVRRSPLGGPVQSLYRRLWPLTADERNVRYDAETEAVMARVLRPDSVCLDIGAHEGALLAAMLRYAPQGQHWAFEPLPVYAVALRRQFPQVTVCEVALSDAAGPVAFQHVLQHPGYSGLRPRRYPDGASEATEAMTVQAARLDDLVPVTTPVRFVKVDVEGAELAVFRGGQRLLATARPVIVFEHGRPAAKAYGTRPEQVYDLLAACGLRVTLMAAWLAGQPDLTRAHFVRQFEAGPNFYFLAYPADWRTR